MAPSKALPYTSCCASNTKSNHSKQQLNTYVSYPPRVAERFVELRQKEHKERPSLVLWIWWKYATARGTGNKPRKKHAVLTSAYAICRNVFVLGFVPRCGTGCKKCSRADIKSNSFEPKETLNENLAASVAIEIYMAVVAGRTARPTFRHVSPLRILFLIF